jgi:hypothetical protein
MLPKRIREVKENPRKQTSGLDQESFIDRASDTLFWQKIATFSWHLKIHCHVLRRQSLYPILCHISPIHHISTLLLLYDQFNTSIGCPARRLIRHWLTRVIKTQNKAQCRSFYHTRWRNTDWPIDQMITKWITFSLLGDISVSIRCSARQISLQNEHLIYTPRCFKWPLQVCRLPVRSVNDDDDDELLFI